MTNLINTTADVASLMGDVNPTATGNVESAEGKAKRDAAAKKTSKTKAATTAQLLGVYANARAGRTARAEIVRIVREAHKQGRDLSALKQRYLMGWTIDAVPAIKKAKINALDAETMDWQSILPLWLAEAGRANPDADPKSKATKAKGGLRSPEFDRAYRNAETAWSAIRRDAGVIDEPAGEGRRSGAGKGRPQGTTGGQVNAGKTPDAGNVAPNPEPTADKADKPEPTPEPTPVVPTFASNLDAARWTADRVAEIVAAAERNVNVYPNGLSEALAAFALESQKALLAIKRTRGRK